MADSSVLLEVIVEGKGVKVVQRQLDQVAASTNKASKATENLTNSRNNYNKGEKGVASAGANSTKNFSKMRQVIDGGGSSGLVAAYATLAANLFAATAAFNALRSASKVEQLIQGLETIGTISGRNLGVLAENLREVTGFAISTEQALRSTALATSAGFSDAQLKNLGTIAKGASIALGRDMTDALDRLVRGTAKLEPEILDELGIFVRLDDAVSNYATSVGKSVSEVTEFERRQAFLNETIVKGIERFAEIADASEANPFDKLAAALSDLAKNVLKQINGVIIPVLNLFTKNSYALGGALILFASTISRQMLPALADSSKALAANAREAANNAAAQAKNLPIQKESLKGYNSLIGKIQEGTATQADFKTGLNSLDGSLATSNKRLTAAAKNHGVLSEQYKATKLDVDRVTAARAQLLRVMSMQGVANAKEKVALGISQLQSGSLLLAYRSLTGAVADYSRALALSNVQGSVAITIMNGMKVAGFALATGLRAVGSAFFTMLGPLGILLSFGPLIYDWFKNKFYPDNTNEKAQELIKNLESITKTTGYYIAALDKGVFRADQFATAISGTIQTASDAIQEAFAADVQAAQERRNKILALEKEIRERRAAGEVEGTKNKNAKGKSTRTDLGKAVDELDELNSSNTTYAENFNTTIEVARAAIGRLQAEAASGVTFINPVQIALIKRAEEQFAKNEISFTQFMAVLTAARAPAENFKLGLQGINDEGKKFKDEVNRLSAKTATPFDNLLEATQGLEKNYKQAKKGANELFSPNDRAGRLQEATKQLRDELGKLGFTGPIEDLEKFNNELATSLKRQRELPGEIKAAQGALKKLTAIRNADAGVLKLQLDAEDDLNKKRRELVSERIKTLDQLQEKGVLSNDQAKEYNDLKGEEAALKDEALKIATKEELIAVQRVEDEKKLFDLSSKVLGNKKATLKAQQELEKVEYQLQKLAAGGTEEMSAAEELALFLKQKDARANLMAEEFKLKIAGIDLEYDLLEAKFELLVAEAKVRGVEISNQGRITDLLKQGRKSSIEAATAEYNLSVKRLELEEAVLRKKAQQAEPGFAGSTTEFLQEMSNAQATGQGTIDVAKDNEKRANDAVLGAAGVVGNLYDQGGSAAEIAAAEKALADARQAADDAAIGVKQSFIMATLQGVQPMLDKLRELGPEGELVATITESAGTMAIAFLELGKAGTSAADKMAAVGAIVSSIGNIMAASSKARIAGIDKEIEAEKKRDGKSKESLAKIQALEKKKEKAERKAFEQNKMIKMAETIINTAAAVMKFMSTGNIGMAIASGVLGAAQLAIIARTSYTGGSSSGGGSNVPSEFSVGERSNKVDVSQQATGSELSGLRGGKGLKIGGMPGSAFMGARYRAEGGPTAGYVVGEQGPELFVPETPGRIVPNDEMKQSQPLNVNFTVQAIDASSFNDALTTQRGNIISMIREAANTYGETFLENVNDTAINAGGGKI